MIRRVALAALLLLTQAAAAADDPADYAWDMHRGAQVALATVLHDEAGQDISLAAAGAGKPLILDLGYFHCPSLCGVARSDMLAALSNSGLVAGQDYALVSLSIDPAETPHDAATAKAADLAQTPGAGGVAWHYLTGPADAIGAVAAAVGFRNRYDAEFRQFLHPTGLVVLTRTGLVSGYLQGVGYTGGDLRAAVLRAGAGGIARAALPVLLLCFHFDSATGRYSLAIMKVLRLMAGFTVLTLGALMLALRRKGRAAAP